MLRLFLSVLIPFLLLEPPALHQGMTPLLLEVQDAPRPFTGSDGFTHLVYELWLTNFSSGEANIENVEVLSDGKLLQRLDQAAIRRQLQPAGQRDATGSLGKGERALPVNGRVFVAQRYAVDWEQIDAGKHIYVGPREKLTSYTIFGKPVLAVADATVAVVTTGLPEQTPGKYPSNISLDEADGNAVILDLGQHGYALYAHMQSESIHLHRGDRVKRGQVIGLVGNSGNSMAPHLHFQVMSSEFSLASNGLPYEIENFQIAARSPGTKAFDEAEANGTPLNVAPVLPVKAAKNMLPLDQLIISFQPASR